MTKLDIDRIAFFGRTYAEYMDMFALDKTMIGRGRILDCPAGASSFAAEAYRIGINVTASDILYGLDAKELVEKGRKDMEHVFEKFDEVSRLYTWKYYKDKDEVMSLRSRALNVFAGDFRDGLKEGRYIQAALPCLPFPDKSFSLVLSGNFLFLYGDRLDFDFHVACIKELVRVSSGEIRIFPLLGLDFEVCPYVDEVISRLSIEGIKAEITDVPFEFQRGANKMMSLRRK